MTLDRAERMELDRFAGITEQVAEDLRNLGAEPHPHAAIDGLADDARYLMEALHDLSATYGNRMKFDQKNTEATADGAN